MPTYSITIESELGCEEYRENGDTPEQALSMALDIHYCDGFDMAPGDKITIECL